MVHGAQAEARRRDGRAHACHRDPPLRLPRSPWRLASRASRAPSTRPRPRRRHPTRPTRRSRRPPGPPRPPPQSPRSLRRPRASAVKHSAPAKAKATATVKTGAKVAAPVAAAKAKPAVAKAPTAAAKNAAPVDPSDRLLAFLAKGKTLVILFHGAGADDRAARKAVHRTALGDPKHVVSAYIPIGDVGKYEAITSDVQVLSAPSILVIGTDGKATLLTGYVDAAVVRQTVGDARRESAADAKHKTTK